ncbi:MAG TPA: aminotransferase class IV [Solirubrobacteraceae bacterium]|jgi:branched-chain amino acid aminotransferase|nr:aminotransferase class IV [Solirubrobacteraceae bacterium]
MPSAQAGCVSVNGRLTEPRDAAVSALDSGFLLGDGLFESLRACDGRPYLLSRHLARLLSAAAELEFENIPSEDTLATQVHRTLERAALADAYVRVTLTRGSGATALAPPSGAPTVVIAALPAPARADAGIRATLLGPPSEIGAKAKSTSRQQAVLARRRVQRQGAGEGIYVSEEGHVLEGVSSNVFAVSDGRLLTPPAEHCLPGITRGRLLELAAGAGISTLQAPLELDVLMGAEEAFVTNAVQGVRSLRAIDGAKLGKPSAEGVFARLAGLYEADRRAGVAGSA